MVQAVISLHGRTFSTNGLSIPTSFVKRSKFKAVYVLTCIFLYFLKIHVHRYLPGTCQCPFNFFGSCFTQNKIQAQLKEMSSKGSNFSATCSFLSWRMGSQLVSVVIGSPPFISAMNGHVRKGSHNPILRGLTSNRSVTK